MRSEAEVCHAVEAYAGLVRRVCFYHLKNRADTEDVFQTVFLKYMLHEEAFSDEEHERAWLLRVSINACKDYLKNFFRRNMLPLDALREVAAEEPEGRREVLEAVLSLPKKYRDVIYLHYYEGYSALEMGRILGKKENTVYSLLSRGRGILKKLLEDGPAEKGRSLGKLGGGGIEK